MRLVNCLGVTEDYLLSDSVADVDSHIMDQFKQIVDGHPLERKQVDVNKGVCPEVRHGSERISRPALNKIRILLCFSLQ